MNFQDIDIAIMLLALIVGMYVTDIRGAYKRHRQAELEKRDFSPEREKLRNMERYLGSGKR
jgi:hypothetical protein